jgi:hypothetical protein
VFLKRCWTDEHFNAKDDESVVQKNVCIVILTNVTTRTRNIDYSEYMGNCSLNVFGFRVSQSIDTMLEKV